MDMSSVLKEVHDDDCDDDGSDDEDDDDEDLSTMWTRPAPSVRSRCNTTAPFTVSTCQTKFKWDHF